MNSKIRNALLIIMNDRSFKLSENSVLVQYMHECMSIVHGLYDVLSIFSYTVVVNQFCSCTVVGYHIIYII